MTSKLTRKQIREGLETVPIEGILGKAVSSQLTAKQKKFAMEVAKGATKADAYRKAYKANPAPSSLVADPYRIAANPRVRAEIEAYQAAIEAAKYRTPAALRELVIQSLVSVVINPETKDSVKVAAAKVLGTVTEVAAFTERKEIKTISTSEDAKSRIMGELKRLISESAEDATIVDTQADALLRELSGPDAVSESSSVHDAGTDMHISGEGGAEPNPGGGDPHPAGPPAPASDGTRRPVHSIPSKRSVPESVPHKRSVSEPNSADPTPSTGEGTPFGFESGTMDGGGNVTR